MSENTDHSRDSSDKKWYADRNVQLTILGVAGTIIAAVITILPQYIGTHQNPEPTQTPIVWTATVVELPTDTPEPTSLPTDTAIPAPTETATLTPTSTPVTPPISCLDRWQVVSSNEDLTGGSGSGDCSLSSVPALGISASRAGIGFGLNGFKEQGNFGIATELPAEATVSLQVALTVLTQGEFWIALSNTPNPENNMFILAVQPNTGELRLYSDQTSRYNSSYNYSELLTNTILSSGLPYSYKITFAISGNSVQPRIHFTDLPAQIVNLPKYLFIGYNNKSTLGSVSLQAEISELTVETK